MRTGRRIPGIENVVASFSEEVESEFAQFVHFKRTKEGLTYRQIAERENVHPTTIQKYVKRADDYYDVLLAIAGDGFKEERPPNRNAVALTCPVCEEAFTSARADKRYCSNACRQDAYRKRKLGAA